MTARLRRFQNVGKPGCKHSQYYIVVGLIINQFAKRIARTVPKIPSHKVRLLRVNFG